MNRLISTLNLDVNMVLLAFSMEPNDPIVLGGEGLCKVEIRTLECDYN